MTRTTPTALFALRHISNGEAYINIDTPEILLATDIATYHKLGTNVLSLDIKGPTYRYVPTKEEKRALAIDIRTAFPTARVRIVKRGVKITPSAGMVEAWELLGAQWQIDATAKMSHAAMVHKTINTPAYRAFQN